MDIFWGKGLRGTKESKGRESAMLVLASFCWTMADFWVCVVIFAGCLGGVGFSGSPGACGQLLCGPLHVRGLKFGCLGSE